MITKPTVSWIRWMNHPWETYNALKEWKQHYEYFLWIKEELQKGTVHVLAEGYIQKLELDYDGYLIPQDMSRAKKYFKFKVLRFTMDEGRPSFLCTGPKNIFLMHEIQLWEMFLCNTTLMVEV